MIFMNVEIHKTSSDPPKEGQKALLWIATKNGHQWVYGAVQKAPVSGEIVWVVVLWLSAKKGLELVELLEAPEYWAEWPKTDPKKAPRAETLKVQPPRMGDTR